MHSRSPKEEIKYLQDLKDLVLELDQGNLQMTVELTMKLFDENFPLSFNIVLIGNTISSFISQRKDINIYIEYLQNIEKKEEEILKVNPHIFQLLKGELLYLRSKESKYFLAILIEKNLISSDNVSKLDSQYFAHLLTEEQLKELEERGISTLYWSRQNNQNNLKDFIVINRQNKFEKHKINIAEGNPSEISKAIRDDDVEQLQKLTSGKEFDFNQHITPSIYEQFSKCFRYDEEHGITLIEYAAFYGAIKCFKYLLLNGSDIQFAGNYAVAGGNIEIFHLCEQNGTTFRDSYKDAVKYHRNNIFYYLYENNIFKYYHKERKNFKLSIKMKYFDFKSKPYKSSFSFVHNNQQILTDEECKNMLFTSIVIKSIQYNNFEIFSFMENQGFEYNESIIEELFISGNLFLIKYLFDEKDIPSEAFAYSVSSHNIELVKYVLSRKNINVNIYDV